MIFFNFFMGVVFFVGLSSYNLDASQPVSKKRKEFENKEEVDTRKIQSIILFNLRNSNTSSSSSSASSSSASLSSSSSSISSQDDIKTLCDIFAAVDLVRQALIPFLPDFKYKNYFDFRLICKAARDAVEYKEIQDEFKKALREGRLDVNAKDKFGNTLLHLAAAYGNINWVDFLIRSGASIFEVNSSSQTSRDVSRSHVIAHRLGLYEGLLDGAQSGDDKLVDAALEAGCFPSVNNKNDQRYTPLHYAATSGHQGIVAKLIVAGAQVNLQDADGYTSLHRAVSPFYDGFAHPEVVQLLLTVDGIDINVQNLEGNTPLHIVGKESLEGDNLEAVRLLLHANADITITNNDGFTAVQLAENNEGDLFS